MAALCHIIVFPSSRQWFLTDLENGCYEIRFTPLSLGRFCLKVSSLHTLSLSTLSQVFIFGRPIKDCPLMFNVTSHNSPVLSFGRHGSGEAGLIQPCSLALDRESNIYVMDTGNSRIKVLDSELEFSRHITSHHLEGRGVTGLCMGLNMDTLVSVNWRTKTVAELTLDGDEVGSFSHEEMVEPIAVSLTPQVCLLSSS